MQMHSPVGGGSTGGAFAAVAKPPLPHRRSGHSGEDQGRSPLDRHWGREAVTRCNGVSRALLPHQETLIATVVSDRLEMPSCVKIRKESIHAIDNQCLIDQSCTQL